LMRHSVGAYGYICHVNGIKKGMARQWMMKSPQKPLAEVRNPAILAA
jgi:hypothetical protein